MNQTFAKTLLLFFFLLLGLSQTRSQELFSIHLDNQNKLPTNAYYNIQKDSLGFIWMAGNEGLMRFDGSRYVIYKSHQQTSTPGSDIKIDRLGRIWYQNFDGYIYYVAKDSLKGIGQQKPVGFAPFGLTSKYVLAAQKNGIDVFDIESLSFLKTIPLKIEEPEHATTIGDDYYYIADDIIYRLDKDLKLSTSTFFKSMKMKVKLIFPYKNGLFIVSKNNETQQLYFFDAQLNFQKSIAITQIKFIQASNVIDNRILLYSPKGIYAYDEQGKLQIDKMNLLREQSVASILKDYQNNYWIATTNNGVFVVPEVKNKLYELPNYRPLRITAVPDGYIMGTQTGEVLLLNKQFEPQKTLSSNNENLPVYYSFFDKVANQLIFSAKGFSILSDKNFSKETNYNVALKEAIRLDDKYIAYAASGFCAIALNPISNNISSIWDELYKQNEAKEIPNTARIIKGLRAKSVDYNPALQQIIYATNVGLYLVSPNEIKEITQQEMPFYADNVIWIKNDIYALDTKGNLFKISNGKVFTQINKTLGIPDFDIKKIKKYDNELLIIGSKYIYQYNTQTKDLYQTQIDIGINAVKDAIKVDQELIILSRFGILNAALNQSKREIPARFVINSVALNGIRKDSTSLMQLDFSENELSIDYSLLDYGGNSIPLAYRINNKDWTPIHNTSGTLEFPSLSPGNYTIEFMVGNQLDKQKIQLNIIAPFWKAWWFYLLASVLIGLIVVLYYKRQSKSMQKQITLLNEKVLLEKHLSKSVLTSIKSQMNPHFFYNALNTIQAYIFANDKENANTYLAKFSKLTRIILEMSEKETISLSEELESLRIYLDLEKMRFSDSLDYNIELINIADKESIEFPPMLIQPYVENALKHGLLHRENEKQLQIIFQQMEQCLQVQIIDNGIGREKSAAINKIKNEKHQSFSSKANEKRLEILNKRSDNNMGLVIEDLYDEKGLASGTKVTLSIPLE